MATVEDYASQIREQLAVMGEPQPLSEMEFLRRQDVAMSERFGLLKPQFRTAISLRFYGAAVHLHDLNAEIVGSVIVKVVDLIEKAATRVAGVMGPVGVFFSPIVQPGSTIITLFGAPRLEREGEPPLSNEIVDTPLDTALERVFRSIEVVLAAGIEIDPSELNLPGDVGEKLFLFANHLISSDVDLDLTWTKASGKSLTKSIDSEKARHILSILNRPVTSFEDYREFGVVEQIAVNGLFKTRIETGHRRIVTLEAPEERREMLRTLWGKRVEIRYRETLISHPQRAHVEPEFEFKGIQAAPVPDTLDL